MMMMITKTTKYFFPALVNTYLYSKEICDESVSIINNYDKKELSNK